MIPSHLPDKLTITLWDFSWYTMTMENEPFACIETACKEAVERGYNTVRICTMPLLLFDGSGPRNVRLYVSNLGNGIGVRSRWYNNTGGDVIDGCQHLLKLFRALEKYNLYAIVSSWEYQQSTRFSRDREWLDRISAITPESRFDALAASLDSLVSFLKGHHLDERIAYVELHNEVETGSLTDIKKPGQNVYKVMKPFIENAINFLKKKHPDILFTISYTILKPNHRRFLAGNIDVAHFHYYTHCYSHEMLRELYYKTGINKSQGNYLFSQAFLDSILREDAPPMEECDFSEENKWRIEKNPDEAKQFYIYDWIDPDKWDLFLYENYHHYRQAIFDKVDAIFESIADLCMQKSIPAVIGEGYVGYTPLEAAFEEGPVGKSIAEYAIRKGMELEFWGMVTCSNCAPHHGFWQDVRWQKKMNKIITEGS